MIWNFFDSIRCITLISRKDRYLSSRSVFNKHNIPVKYYKTTKHPNGGIQGCFESHINVISEAYDSGAERLLIFEDDIIDTKFLTDKTMKRVIRFLKKADWDIFFLGPQPVIQKWAMRKTKFKSIYQMHSICGHAYILNRPYMKKIRNMSYIDVPIDCLYKYNEKSYGHVPSLFRQRASESNISGHMFNRFSLSKMGYIKFFEYYSLYINLPLPLFVSILAIVIFFTFRYTNNILLACILGIMFILCLLLLSVSYV